MYIGSAFSSPAQAGSSSLPAVQYQPPPVPIPSPQPSPVPPSRILVQQQIELSPKRNASFTERFSVGGTPGVRVSDILKDAAALDGANERVLERTGVRQIRLVISWPGYDEVGRYISVQVRDTTTNDSRFITRAEFAKQICMRLSGFMKQAATPRREHALWAIGKHGFTIDNLWLLSVGPARGNMWFAELEVLQ
ncbi:hypothetical protein BD413DRAFT_463866 [Trametes elegans]|nr:hypothetical protein BD413DRAFT_463866 [Trametes elegans]